MVLKNLSGDTMCLATPPHAAPITRTPHARSTHASLPPWPTPALAAAERDDEAFHDTGGGGRDGRRRRS